MRTPRSLASEHRPLWAMELLETVMETFSCHLHSLVLHTQLHLASPLMPVSPPASFPCLGPLFRLLEGRGRVSLIYADIGFSQHQAHKLPCELASWAQLSSRPQPGRAAGRGPSNWFCECRGQVAGASSINVSQLSLSRVPRPCQPWQYWLKRVAGTHPRL